jgi:hypothetical protein
VQAILGYYESTLATDAELDSAISTFVDSESHLDSDLAHRERLSQPSSAPPRFGGSAGSANLTRLRRRG